MTLVNLIPHAIKVIACASRAGSIALVGRRSGSLPSPGHGLEDGRAPDLSAAPSCPGWEPEPAGGTPVQLAAGISLLSSSKGWISETRRELPSRFRIIRGVTRS